MRDPEGSKTAMFPTLLVVAVLCVLVVIALGALFVIVTVQANRDAAEQSSPQPASTLTGNDGPALPSTATQPAPPVLPEAPGSEEDMRREAAALRAKRDQLKRELEAQKAAKEDR